MKKLFIALICVAVQATFLVPANAQTVPAATIAPRGPFKPFKPFNITTLAVLKPDTGAGTAPIKLGDKMELVKWKGHNAIRRESTAYGKDGKTIVRWEITVTDAKTVLPYYGEWRRADGLFARHEYDGLHVKESRTTKNLFTTPRQPPGTPLDSVSTTFDLPQVAYDWLGGAGLQILMDLPLKDGIKGSVPVISGDSVNMAPCVAGPCHILTMNYQVSGPVMVTNISGKQAKTWKIYSPEQKFTFWLGVDDHALEQVSWPGPNNNGTFSMTASN